MSGVGNESVRWRVGRSYGIHVYTDTGDKKRDIAVATFHCGEDAFDAVMAHNEALAWDEDDITDMLRSHRGDANRDMLGDDDA